MINYYSFLCYCFQFENHPYHLRWNRDRNRVFALAFLLSHVLCHLFHLRSIILPWKLWSCSSYISSYSLQACFLCRYIVFFSHFSFFPSGHGGLMILWEFSPKSFNPLYSNPLKSQLWSVKVFILYIWGISVPITFFCPWSLPNST